MAGSSSRRSSRRRTRRIRRRRQRLVDNASFFLVGLEPEYRPREVLQQQQVRRHFPYQRSTRIQSSTRTPPPELLLQSSSSSQCSHRRNPTASKFSPQLVLPFLFSDPQTDLLGGGGGRSYTLEWWRVGGGGRGMMANSDCCVYLSKQAAAAWMLDTRGKERAEEVGPDFQNNGMISNNRT